MTSLTKLLFTLVTCLFMTSTVLADLPSSPLKLDFDSLPWELEVDKDNLKVYTAKVPDSSIKAFRGVSTFNATLNQLVSVITDMDHLHEWVNGAEPSRVIKREGNRQWTYYENKIPWPYKNRDGVIIQNVVKDNDEHVSIWLTTGNEVEPVHKGKVRVDDLKGAWLLKKVGENQVELTYQIHFDPAGALPDWVVNMLLTETPEKSLTNLHKVDLSDYNTPSDFLQ